MSTKNRFYDRELDKEAVDRIVVETGLDCSLADREELSIDLPMCRALRVRAKYKFSPIIAKPRAAKLWELWKLTAQLLDLLKEDEIGGDILREIDLRKGDPRASLKSLIAAAQHLLPAALAPIGEKFEIMGRSEFENLAGIALPNVFKIRFHRPAGVSRNKEQEPDGPFIRFAYRALIELQFHKQWQTLLTRSDSQGPNFSAWRTKSTKLEPEASWAKAQMISEIAQLQLTRRI